MSGNSEMGSIKRRLMHVPLTNCVMTAKGEANFAGLFFLAVRIWLPYGMGLGLGEVGGMGVIVSWAIISPLCRI